MASKRKQYTGEEKLAILRKHLLESVAVSDIFAEQKRKLAEPREARAGRRPSVHSEGLLGHLLDASQTGAACAT